MNRSSILALSVLLIAVVIAACGAALTATPAPTATVVPTNTPVPTATAAPALSAGVRCLFAGAGATLTFDGKRLNYTCPTVGSDESGLIGDVTLGAKAWEIEKASYARGSSGWALKSSAKAAIDKIELSDGTVCAYAGSGATLSFDSKRLNFTCPNQGSDTVGLIGNILAGVKGPEIEKALIARDSNGWTLKSSTKVQISGLIVAAPAN